MPNISTKTHPWLRKLDAVWRGLVEPLATLSEPERRRSRVLAVTILMLLVSAGFYLVYIFINPQPGLTDPYVVLIGGLIFLFVVAFGLNRSGHYPAAAGLIVAVTALGTWASIVLNLGSLSHDVVRLSYLVASIMLSSILLPARITVFLAVSQLIAVLVLAIVNPMVTDSNWPSLISFITFVSVVSVVFNFISRRDLDQIDRQTHQLLESEARLLELSVRDPLTGLFNRRYLEETLARELHRAARLKTSVGFIMLDIDHFKHFNDTYGHEAGDSVLRAVSACLRARIRADDIACRYGGEELVLILPAASLAITEQRAAQVLEKLRALRVEHHGHELGLITASLGVASFPEHGETGEAILAQADAALYRAKGQGRNQIVVAEITNAPKS